MRKRLLILLIINALFLVSIVCAACTTQQDSGELQFTLSADNQSYYVSGYNFTEETSVVIPETYNKKPVTAIGVSSFENCTLLTEIKFSANVKFIHLNAFHGCTALKRLDIPDNVISIGIGAFSDCTSLLNVSIGDGVQKIDTSTFSDCTSLQSVKLGNAVTEISGFAFSGCQSLISLTLGKRVKTIGMNAFDNCRKLIEIYNNSPLQLTVGSNDNGYVAKYALNVFTTTNIKSNIDTSLDDYVFWRSGGYNYLIDYTGKDEEITLPNGDYEIYNYAFYKNTIIQSVDIPNGVTGIGNWAFRECPNLTNISIGDGVTKIGISAFYESKGIIDIIDGICYVDNWAVDCDDECPDIVTLRVGTIGVSHSAFTKAQFKEINMNSELKYIGQWAFNGCTALQKVVFSKEIDFISAYLFYGCENLKEITMWNNVSTIAAYAFDSCTSLEKIFYLGEPEEFAKISINMGNSPFVKAEVTYL